MKDSRTDQNAQVSQVRLIDHTTPGNPVGDVTRTLAGTLRYLPFGPLTSLTYGNGLPLQRAFDPDYRLSAQSVGSVQSLGYAYDPAGNVQGITLNPRLPGQYFNQEMAAAIRQRVESVRIEPRTQGNQASFSTRKAARRGPGRVRSIPPLPQGRDDPGDSLA